MKPLSLSRLSPLPCLLLLACFGCDPSDGDGALDGGAELGPEYAAAQGDCDPTDPADPFAQCVDQFEPADGVSYGHDDVPGLVLGPPMGGGMMAGGTDVVSLGCGGSITVALDPGRLRDEPGPDFIVFENAFEAGSITFVEPALVLVSADGEHWSSFACDPLPGEDLPPAGCAGQTPVLATDEATAVDPTLAGGDAYDLAEVGLPHARYVRIVDRTEEHYGTRTWCEGAAGGFDLDAVVALGGRGGGSR